jgi:uncharacterized membrane protein
MGSVSILPKLLVQSKQSQNTKKDSFFRQYSFPGGSIAGVCGAVAIIFGGLLLMSQTHNNFVKSRKMIMFLGSGAVLALAGLVIFGFSLSLVEQALPGTQGSKLEWVRFV